MAYTGSDGGTLRDDAQNITMHLKSIDEEEELVEHATCKDFLQVRKEGIRTVKRKQLHYSLDAII